MHPTKTEHINWALHSRRCVPVMEPSAGECALKSQSTEAKLDRNFTQFISSFRLAFVIKLIENVSSVLHVVLILLHCRRNRRLYVVIVTLIRACKNFVVFFVSLHKFRFMGDNRVTVNCSTSAFNSYREAQIGEKRALMLAPTQHMSHFSKLVHFSRSWSMVNRVPTNLLYCILPLQDVHSGWRCVGSERI